MDAVEKVLNNLIDSMHKHIAKGHGDKKLNASKELEKAHEVSEAKEERAPEKSEPSIFDNFLQKAKDNKAKTKRVEMTMISAPAKKKKK